MAHTAPPGYDNNHSAIFDLIRFGPGIWSSSQMMALLFHAERSTAYGKDSDKHDEDQAINGIYSSRLFAWIRGPSGLSRATWYRVNTDLAIEGVLRKHRQPGRGNVVEFEIDWKAVKARIEAWKRSHVETFSETEGSQSETLPARERVSNRDGKGLNLRPFSEEPDVENKEAAKNKGSQFETHSQTLTLKSDLHSQSDWIPTRSEIAEATELSCGDRARTDGLIDKIRLPAAKLRLPIEVIRRWMDDFTFAHRDKYTVTAGLLGTSFATDIIPWLKKNERFVSGCLRQRELALSRKAALGQMRTEPDAPPATEPAVQTESDLEFGPDLMRQIQARRGAKA